MDWKLFFDRLRLSRERPRPPNLFDEIRIGLESQVLLDSPAAQRALQTMRVKIHEAWANSPVEDAAGQHELRIMLKVLDGFEAHIREEADTAKLAKRQQDMEQQKRVA